MEMENNNSAGKFTSPEEVLRNLVTDLKIQHITHKIAAEKLGYNSRQTFSNIVSSKKYLSFKQAKRFNHVFGYNIEYLVAGKGQLKDTKESKSLELSCLQKSNNTKLDLSFFVSLSGFAETIIRLTGNKDAIDAWHAITNGDFSEYVEKLNRISQNQNP